MQERYADVIVDISSEKLDRVFQYRIPEQMEGMLEPGTVVEVPFGKANRPVKGYVTGISGQAGYDPARMKEIGRVMTCWRWMGMRPGRGWIFFRESTRRPEPDWWRRCWMNRSFPGNWYPIN